MTQYNSITTLATQSRVTTRVNNVPFNMRGWRPYACFMDNDALFVFNDRLSSLIVILRVKNNGEWCCYSNVQNPFSFGTPVFNNIGAYCLQLNRNTMLLNNGNGRSNYVVIPEYFQACGIVFISPLSFSPAAPCGAGTRLHSYYDFKRNLLAYSYADNHPVSQNYWASIYKASPYGFSLLTGGYLGNYASTIDPFARGASNAFASVQFGAGHAYAAYDKGRIIVASLANGNVTQTGYINRWINYAPLACGIASDAAYAYTEPAQNFLDSTVKNNWSDPNKGHTSVYNTGACNIGDYVLQCSAFPILYLWNAYNNLEIDLTGDLGSTTMAGASIDTAGNIVILQCSNGSKSANIYTASAATDILPALPPNVGRAHRGLMNFHRPVSILGSFKA